VRPGAAATSSGLAAGSWQRADAAFLPLAAGPASTIAAVLAPSPTPAASTQWLAVGTSNGPDGQLTATLWASSDGLSWTPTALGPAGSPSSAQAVAAWGTRTVIVGSVGQGTARRAAVWMSAAPGEPFAAQPAVPAFEPSDIPPAAGAVPGAVGASMNLVAGGALGLFAAGSVDGRQALWYSTDGQHWQRLTDGERLLAGSPGVDVRALLVAPTGVYAAGSITTASGTDGALWSSTDAIHWSLVGGARQAFSGDGDHVIDGLTTFGNAFVAVGGVRQGGEWLPASWISPNGLIWGQASEAFPMSTRGDTDPTGTTVAAVTSVPGTPSELVAVGGSPSSQRMWTSTDGQSWTEVPLPPGAAADTSWQALLVASDGPTTVVGDPTPGHPRLLTDTGHGWQEITAVASSFGAEQPLVQPVALLSVDGRLVLTVNVSLPSQQLGSPVSTVDILTSTDGTHWSLASTGGPFSGGAVRDVIDSSAGLVAVGSRQTIPAGSGAAATGTEAQAAVWSSLDAVHWGLSSGLGTGPNGYGEVGTVTTAGPQMVALGVKASGTGGLDTSQPFTWSSSDGQSWTPLGPFVPAAASANGGAAASKQQSLLAKASNPLVNDECSAAGTVVAVGSTDPAGASPSVGSWVSVDAGVAWTVAPVSGTGGTEMQGCVPTGNSFVGYGITSGHGGAVQPGLWRSATGASWTEQVGDGFDDSGGPSVSDLATDGTRWLATTGPSVDRSGQVSGQHRSATGLWASTDAGKSWSPVPLSAPAWSSDLGAPSLDLVAFLGTTAVVVGVTDGHLAVWLGTPPAASAP
jgi:hypothetical protein